MSKKLLFYFVIVLFGFLFLNIKYYKLEVGDKNIASSLIGLTIDGSSTTNFPSKSSGYAIDKIVCDKGASGVWDYESWTLRLRNVIQSRTKCQVNFVSKYTENILNGTDPVLKDELIPVIIESDGTVKKASLGWEWYDYETQEWANAVILEDENMVYQDGQIIPESNIESYFVWIPRYKYKIWNMGEYEDLSDHVDSSQIHTIELIFGTDTTTDTETTCVSPLVSGESGNCSVGKYMTHPAFIASGTNGMWVGKFETGYKGTNSKEEAQKNENNPSKIQIKPNVYSWRSIQVVNAHFNSYNYKRDYNSHMMKNTEWGAVAYLQHSQYGSHESIRMNNNALYITGYAATKKPTCGHMETSGECKISGTEENITQPWNTNTGHLASTTNNISGIYDMAGGAWEYTMGIMLDQNKNPMSGRNSIYNSGFAGSFGCPTCDNDTSGKTQLINDFFFPEEKYYDTYVYSTVDEKYHRRILGDATGEIGPFFYEKFGSWYANYSWFSYSSFPWFRRGGDFSVGTSSGIFSFIGGRGHASTNDSYRIVLSF